MIETSRETVGSALAFYERFCQRAEKHIAKHAAKAAQVGEVARVRMAREQANKGREEEAKAKARIIAERKVEHVVSAAKWEGVESFLYEARPTTKDRSRRAVLLLKETPFDVVAKVAKGPFPQISITPYGEKAILLTLFKAGEWRIKKLDWWSTKVEVELARA